MSERTKITFHKGGTGERTVTANQVIIPDLWHIAQNNPDPEQKRAILDTWHIAHGLLNHIIEN